MDNTVNINIDKLLSFVTLAGVVVGVIWTWAVSFNYINENRAVIDKHDKRIDALERDDTIRTKLGQIQESVNYLNWRMDAVTKQIESAKDAGKH